jgi:hypothetical protein
VTSPSLFRERNSVEATACPGCGEQMLDFDDCTTTLIADIAGVEHERIRYGSEPYFSGRREGRRCHDCHVTVGNLHHCACDFEACPACGGQALGCDCSTNAGGYACPVHGPGALAMHRLTPLAIDPAGLDSERDDLMVTVCTRCHRPPTLLDECLSFVSATTAAG